MRVKKRVEQFGYVEGPKDGSYFLRYWSEPDAKGKRTRRAVEVGTKGKFHSRQEATLSEEAGKLRRQINAGILGKTMGQVIAHYERDKMPTRGNTRIMIQSALHHCREKWDNIPITELALPTNSKLIEGWLDGLRRRPVRKGTPDAVVSYSTKKNVRFVMGALFKFAMKQGYIPAQENPMSFVKIEQGEIPDGRQTLTVKHLADFFRDPKVPEYVKAMAQVARLTGLRISEIRGLKKEDFDLDKDEMQVRRRLFRHEVGKPKTKASGKPIPLPEELYEILSAWFKSDGFYPTQEDWAFASPVTGIPYSSEGTQSKILKPWGERHGIKKMGWHTFRHTFKRLAEENGVYPTVIQRLMRHSRWQVTEKYGDGVEMEMLRKGQQAVAEAMQPKPVVVKRKRQWA